MMAEWVHTARGALLFRTPSFVAFRDRSDVFLRGFVVVVAVALIAGLPAFVIGLGHSFRGPTVTPAEAADAAAAIESSLGALGPFLQGLPPTEREQVMEQIRQGFEAGLQIGAGIENLPTLLPRPVGRSLQTIGAWLSRPFDGVHFPLSVASLGTWLGYGILVMLAAKLLGGRGDLPGFLGTTGLYAVPHLLNIFHPVPVLGAVLGVIAFVWGVAIYTKATAVSHEISLERAILAVLLPLVVFVLLALIAILGLAAILIIVAGG